MKSEKRQEVLDRMNASLPRFSKSELTPKEREMLKIIKSIPK